MTVGAVPAVPAGDWSALGIGPMARSGPPPASVVEVAVAEGPLPVLDEVLATACFPLGDGEELQAARPNAPAAARRHTRAHGREWRLCMGRDGSRSARAHRGRALSG